MRVSETNPNFVEFETPLEFNEWTNKRYGSQVGRVIRSSMEYTGDPQNPVEYTYWQHENGSSKITFYKSLADKEFKILNEE